MVLAIQVNAHTNLINMVAIFKSNFASTATFLPCSPRWFRPNKKLSRGDGECLRVAGSWGGGEAAEEQHGQHGQGEKKGINWNMNGIFQNHIIVIFPTRMLYSILLLVNIIPRIILFIYIAIFMGIINGIIMGFIGKHRNFHLLLRLLWLLL